MYYICLHNFSFKFLYDDFFQNSVPEHVLFKYFHKKIALRKCKLTHTESFAIFAENFTVGDFLIAYKEIKNTAKLKQLRYYLKLHR